MQVRLQQLLDKKGISPARFAEIVGVQRSGVSHILSGRNNPSLDFIRKILDNFPDLNSEWLITGNGEMFKNNAPNSIDSAPKAVVATGNLFEQETVIKAEPPVDIIEPPQEPVITKEPEQEKYENIAKTISQKSGIERIVIFYDDNTFKEYTPK